MDAALDILIANSPDDAKVKSCIQLMNTYAKNIVKYPDNPKYRRIKITNPKFNTNIWSFEEARTLLLLAGFEQEDDSLVLPMGSDLTVFQMLLEKRLSQLDEHLQPSTSSVPDSSQGPQSTNNPMQSQPHLKLASTSHSGKSMFDVDVKPDMTLLSYLIEMGYEQDVAKKALIKTSNCGVQPAMDWIDLHRDELITDDNNRSLAASATVSSSSIHTGTTESLGTANTDDGHMRTPISRYQKVADQKHQFQERQRLEAIAAAREAKRADKKYKEYLLKNLQAERNTANEKFERQKISRADVKDSCDESVEGVKELSHGFDQMQSEGEPIQHKEVTRIRVRLQDGKDLHMELESSCHIKELYEYVSQASSCTVDEFILATPFPPSELSDLSKTLKEAGLFPSATLMVKSSHGRKPFEEEECCTHDQTQGEENMES